MLDHACGGCAHARPREAQRACRAPRRSRLRPERAARSRRGAARPRARGQAPRRQTRRACTGGDRDRARIDGSARRWPSGCLRPPPHPLPPAPQRCQGDHRWLREPCERARRPVVRARPRDPQARRSRAPDRRRSPSARCHRAHSSRLELRLRSVARLEKTQPRRLGDAPPPAPISISSTVGNRRGSPLPFLKRSSRATSIECAICGAPSWTMSPWPSSRPCRSRARRAS